jgi:hypothetical protein
MWSYKSVLVETDFIDYNSNFVINHKLKDFIGMFMIYLPPSSNVSLTTDIKLKLKYSSHATTILLFHTVHK